MDLSFLNNVVLGDLIGKDEKIQSVRFNKDEFYMLKFIAYRKKRFATYIKELIDKDIKNYLENNGEENESFGAVNINLEELKKELKEELKEELILEFEKNMKELKSDNEEQLDPKGNIEETKNDILNFLNKNN